MKLLSPRYVRGPVLPCGEVLPADTSEERVLHDRTHAPVLIAEAAGEVLLQETTDDVLRVIAAGESGVVQVGPIFRCIRHVCQVRQSCVEFGPAIGCSIDSAAKHRMTHLKVAQEKSISPARIFL